MDLSTPIRVYFWVIVFLFLTLGVYEQLTVKNTMLNKWVKSALGHKDFHEYLANESRERPDYYPVDEEIAECDYKTMTAKRFFNDYVKKNRPCLFKGYGQH